MLLVGVFQSQSRTNFMSYNRWMIWFQCGIPALRLQMWSKCRFLEGCRMIFLLVRSTGRKNVGQIYVTGELWKLIQMITSFLLTVFFPLICLSSAKMCIFWLKCRFIECFISFSNLMNWPIQIKQILSSRINIIH